MYIGTLRVDATGDTYRFAWETGSSSVGVGVRRGNTVAVAYGDNTCGVMLYERGKNNSLVGVWSAIGVTTTGTEIAVPAGGDLSAGFTVMGTNPGGGTPPYRGQMRLRPTGSTFDIHWTVGDRQYDGIGVRLDGTFGVAYGSPNCGVALYEITADGTLAGAWALRGQTAAGTETNTRR